MSASTFREDVRGALAEARLAFPDSRREGAGLVTLTLATCSLTPVGRDYELSAWDQLVVAELERPGRRGRRGPHPCMTLIGGVPVMIREGSR